MLLTLPNPFPFTASGIQGNQLYLFTRENITQEITGWKKTALAESRLPLTLQIQLITGSPAPLYYLSSEMMHVQPPESRGTSGGRSDIARAAS